MQALIIVTLVERVVVLASRITLAGDGGHCMTRSGLGWVNEKLMREEFYRPPLARSGKRRHKIHNPCG